LLGKVVLELEVDVAVDEPGEVQPGATELDAGGRAAKLEHLLYG
jgi:hypothetical protein